MVWPAQGGDLVFWLAATWLALTVADVPVVFFRLARSAHRQYRARRRLACSVRRYRTLKENHR